ncbi:hypothetical protein F5882DRAFT_461791 [Hyaloscypha sp. PMI_1271]|nr:hypothetical protein F5882DRAFT_461791 [Hyaloscypha sp. PMI_1271]
MSGPNFGLNLGSFPYTISAILKDPATYTGGLAANLAQQLITNAKSGRIPQGYGVSVDVPLIASVTTATAPCHARLPFCPWMPVFSLGLHSRLRCTAVMPFLFRLASFAGAAGSVG